MTRNFANRIGYSIDHGINGGVFNSLSQYILNKNNKWAGDGNLDFPSTLSSTTYTPGDGYTYVVMDSSSLFSVFDGVVTIDYMIVAGGGCNGSQPESDAVGGGGAGGFRSGSATVGPGIYICTVGSGSPVGYGLDKPNGSPSSVESPNGFNITSAGGGRGGSARFPASSSIYEDSVPQVEPTSGGSGGGGGSGPIFYQPMITGSPGNVPAVTPPQGNAGGDGETPARGSGAGGGAGGAGGDANGGAGGAGGVGRAYPFSYTAIPTDWGTPGPTASEPPTARWFAGGGGGASDFPGPHSASVTVGGAGGGGQGDSYDPSNPTNNIATSGQVNTGGGGGGSSTQLSTGGGSGIIIIRYST
jgi:hypothetical protein